MVFKKCNPGCACCKDDECVIPISCVGSTWNQISGDWIITNSCKNLSTGDSDALIIAPNEHPEGLSTHYIKAKVKGDDDGDIIRIVITYTDEDNYLYGEVEVGSVCGYIRLFQVESGNVYQLGEDVPSLELLIGVYHQIYLCYDGTNLTFVVENISYQQTVSVTGTRVGAATGDVYDNISIIDYRWYIHYYEGGYHGEENDCEECEQSCRITHDSFDRSDSTDIGCEWSKISGGCEITSQTLKCTTTTQLINQVPKNTDNEEVGETANVEFYSSNSGEKFRVLIDASSDGTQYHAIEVETGSSKIRIFKNGSKILESDSGVTVPINQWVTLTACIRDDYIFGMFTSSSIGEILSTGVFTVRMYNPYSGLMSENSNDIYFRAFNFYKMTIPGSLDGCPDCFATEACQNCINNVSPQYIKVVFSGITNNVCNDCNIFNSTYILPLLSSADDCYWYKKYNKFDDDEIPCFTGEATSDEDAYYAVSVRITSSGSFPSVTYTITSTISLTYKDGGSYKYYQVRFGEVSFSKFDCMNFDNKSLLFSYQDPTLQCQSNIATCKITTI